MTEGNKISQISPGTQSKIPCPRALQGTPSYATAYNADTGTKIDDYDYECMHFPDPRRVQKIVV